MCDGRFKMPPKLPPAAVLQWRIGKTFIYFFIKMMKSWKYQDKQQQSLMDEVFVPSLQPRQVLILLCRSSTSNKSRSGV